MKPCTEIAAREIHGGTIGCDLSGKTAIVRYREGNRAIAPPEVFKNMFSVRHNKKLKPVFPSENIS